MELYAEAYGHAGIESIYEQVRLYIGRKSSGRVTPALSANRRTFHDAVTDTAPSPRARKDDHQATFSDFQDVIGRPTNISAITTLPTGPDPNTHLNNHSNTSADRTGFADLLPTSLNHELFSDSLPFDDLNVQELWTWMGDLDYENYSYQVPYESNGSL